MNDKKENPNPDGFKKLLQSLQESRSPSGKVNEDLILTGDSCRWLADKVKEHSKMDSDYMSLAYAELMKIADALDEAMKIADALDEAMKDYYSCNKPRVTPLEKALLNELKQHGKIFWLGTSRTQTATLNRLVKKGLVLFDIDIKEWTLVKETDVKA